MTLRMAPPIGLATTWPLSMPGRARCWTTRALTRPPAGIQSESLALASFLNGVPEGQIVAVALQGDGAAYLTSEAVAALHSIGGQADPRGSNGWSHAIIGVKGAAPGTAMEAAGPDSGWLRVAPDRRTLAIAVDTMRWEQMGE